MGRITDLNFLNKIMLKAIWTPHHVTQVDIFLRKAGMSECWNAGMPECRKLKAGILKPGSVVLN